MSFWKTLQISSSALYAQHLRLDLISNNIANAETTKTDEGGPYKRQDVVFNAPGSQPFISNLLAADGKLNSNSLKLNGVQVSKIVTDETPGTKVYDPTHVDADEEGYVTYPNVNMAVEMTNMLSATRSYEANLTVVDAAKTMALKAIEIGR